MISSQSVQLASQVTGKPVILVITQLAGVQSAGVTRVGEVANTALQVQVSSVKAASKLALLGVARNVATFVPSQDTQVEIGSPVQLVSTQALGVHKAGVVSVGLVNVLFVKV